jgi:hypothetical protein
MCSRNTGLGTGGEIISTLSKQLSAEYGSGFQKPNLSRMIWPAEAFPDQAIVAGAVATIELEPFRRTVPA